MYVYCSFLCMLPIICASSSHGNQRYTPRSSPLSRADRSPNNRGTPHRLSRSNLTPYTEKALQNTASKNGVCVNTWIQSPRGAGSATRSACCLVCMGWQIECARPWWSRRRQNTCARGMHTDKCAQPSCMPSRVNPSI